MRAPPRGLVNGAGSVEDPRVRDDPVSSELGPILGRQVDARVGPNSVSCFELQKIAANVTDKTSGTLQIWEVCSGTSVLVVYRRV